MRRKAVEIGSAAVSIPTTENSTQPLIGPRQTPVRPPAGRGLGKAGAKRLGRLIKRAIGGSEEATGKEGAALPKTPFRLLKHQFRPEAENAARASLASLHVSQLILSMVSQCKHRGGMSMAQLKQTLAAAGYDVSKNGRRVKVETKRLVNSETLVRRTRNTMFRLNNKTLTDVKRIRTRSVKPPAAKEKLKQSPALRRSQRIRAANRAADSSHEPAGNTRKQPAAKPQTRRTAVRRKRRAARRRTTQHQKEAKNLEGGEHENKSGENNQQDVEGPLRRRNPWRRARYCQE